MKTYKLLLLVMLVSFTFSCSEDTTEDQTVSVAPGQFDDSHLGVYKGLFTTNDGVARGSVVLNLTPSSEGTAQITLSTGEVIEMKSASFDTTVSNLRFSSMGLSSIDATFDFSVENNGLNPMVSNVSFDNKQSDILIVKDLARAPADPITGTYDCTNCASVGVGFPNGRTWNVMTMGMEGNHSYVVQISYDGRVYNSTSGTQSGCQVFPFAPNYTVCGVSGSAQILGHVLNWTGTHAYSNSSSVSCSSVNGEWTAPTYGPGIFGTFTSDSQCL